MEYEYPQPQGSNNGEEATKALHPNNNGGGIHGDRLSSLPDPILIDILSLLPIKTAVTTGVLSHRWQALWTQIFILDLNSRDFPTTETCNFFTIVDRLLRQQLTSPQITRFKLHFRDPEDKGMRSAFWRSFKSHFRPWISLICDRNVKELEVISDKILNCGNLFSSSVFQCQTLVSLNFSQGFYVAVPDEINLPNLKKLFVRVLDCEWKGRLLRSCPLIEELSLLGSFSKDQHFVGISSQNLKRLTLNMWERSEQTIEVSIDAPNLSFFHFIELPMIKLRFVKQPSSSLEMRIIFGSPAEVNANVKLFQEISNVRSLTLHSAVIKNFDSLDDPELRTLFHNMSSLSWWMPPSHLKVALGFLHRAPNLEFLGLRMSKGARRVKRSSIPLESPPACLLKHVKRILVGTITCSEDRLMELVKYLLCNAKVLECLIVEFGSESESKEVQLRRELELYEHLCKLPKSSPCCQIKFAVPVGIDDFLFGGLYHK